MSFWEEQNCTIEADLDNILSLNPDLIIISAGHSQYKQESTINDLMALSPMLIYDTIGLFDKRQIATLQSKHRVSVLGRGDLK